MASIFKSKNYPIFQNVVYNTAYEAMNCKVIDIEIVQDENTGLIYNNKFKSDIIDYQENYHNEQHFSDVFKKHIFEVKNIIQKYFINRKILEIGCGDGYFLELLLKYGFDIYGMDPTYIGNNERIKKEYYNENNSREYNAFILRHVLEHIQDPYNFLYNLKKIDNNNSLIYIEVPSLEYINENCTFFDFYYEHVNYFREIDFINMFDNILVIDNFFNKQYIYLVAELSSLKLPVKTEDFILNKNFLSKFYYCNDIIKNTKSKTVIWGCASKGVIFSIFLNNVKTKVDYFVDINPYKLYKFMPLISDTSNYGIIESYNDIKYKLDDDSIIFIMNDNYKNEIIDMTNNRFNYIVL
ncbi:class I SAM-dependent methyltransferase [uncultured Brachyspira sp.]|uniref:class I SAM-dependent methyltransferase n=1 Tax=uncultured Brachyspira sp. TaxID=221953 RepID=UPI0026183EC1|nr:class I SAM-dependent methyltransferase [uncultured Brachyspira sp.]